MIVEPEHRDGGADDVHRVRVLRRGGEEINDALRQFAVCAQRLMERVELAPVWQFAVPEQVDDFLEGDIAREFVDVVARIDELADVAEHV